jgi:cyclopropane-fatty-acyl-phospholipid synthase
MLRAIYPEAQSTPEFSSVRGRFFVPSARDIVSNLFASADILINGSRAWDMRVHDDRFFKRLLAGGTLAFGESYMDGWWDCDSLDQLCFRATRARLDQRVSLNWRTIVAAVGSVLINRQSKRRAHLVGRHHYDLGNDFFEAMLDPAMQYSCAYFDGTADLTEAQRRKMDLICRKLALHNGMRLLDIGCGWGGLAKYAAEHYGCSVVGITISQEQQRYAERSCRGLPIEIRLQDYRDLSEQFDRVVSVGMIEHVGFKNYRTYMKMVYRSLTEGGLFLCQSIAATASYLQPDPWIVRYIFPNSMLPSAARLSKAAEGFFVVEDMQNFGAFYDPTLLAWERNVRASWERFSDRYGERFLRMWRYYLLSCAGAFRARSLELFQFVFSKGGVLGGYHLIR